MSELQIFENGIKMTSRDIAELTGKEHKNVMADIRKEAENLDNVGINSSLNFKPSNYISDRGKEYPQYLLSKDGVMMLAMKYDTITRYKITKKLNELENKNSPALPQNYLEALKALVTSEEKRIEAEKQIETNKPLVKFAEKITISESVFNITQIAKEVDMSAKYLNALLFNNKIQFYQGGQWLLYAKYQDKGYTKVKTIEYIDSSGVQKTKHHTVWTEAGRMFILDFIESL